MSVAGYSAKVALTLVVDGLKLRLSHVGPSGLVIREDCKPMPPCDAELIIEVDDSKDVSQVFLPHGIPGPKQPFPFI